MELLLRACPAAASFLVSARRTSGDPLWEVQARDDSWADILLFPQKEDGGEGDDRGRQWGEEPIRGQALCTRMFSEHCAHLSRLCACVCVNMWRGHSGAVWSWALGFSSLTGHEGADRAPQRTETMRWGLPGPKAEHQALLDVYTHPSVSTGTFP